MKKRKRAVIIIVVLILVVALGIIVRLPSAPFPSDWLGTRLYQGQRLVIQLHITVDGEPAEVSKNDNWVYFLYSSDDVAVISARADSYETYEYSVLINDEIPLNITARHWNWWEITRSDVFLDIDTKTDTYTVYENYSYTAESPTYHIEKVSEPKETFEGTEAINVSIGPKG